MAMRIRNRVRVPLFSVMISLPSPLAIPLDAITFGTTNEGAEASPLWFAARTSSKPGLAGGPADCWTLVSTPTFAANEIDRVHMQDASGAFRPQEDSYLNTEPGPELYRAFVQAVLALLPPGAPAPPAVPLYLQGQRWGSAFPAPAAVAERDEQGHGPSTRHILGVAYETALPPLVYETPPLLNISNAKGTDEEAAPLDFLVDESLALYYAGDYCSRRPPGFEAACLSGQAAAHHLLIRAQNHMRSTA